MKYKDYIYMVQSLPHQFCWVDSWDPVTGKAIAYFFKVCFLLWFEILKLRPLATIRCTLVLPHSTVVKL